MEFYKNKDFGELIGSPFTFFVKEFKSLTLSLLVIVGPFLLIEAILIGRYNFSPANDILTMANSFGQVRDGTSYFIQLLEFFKNVMLAVTVGVYFKLHVKKGKGNFSIKNVWNEVRKFYWSIAGAQILSGLILVVAFLLLVIPGIYVSVAFTILYAIIIFEEEGVSKAISRSFDLIKGNWWLIFGLTIVLFIAIIIAIAAISFVFYYTLPPIEISSGMAVMTNLFDLLIETVFSLFLIMISYFIYGHLIGEKENPILIEKISRINTETEIENNRFNEI